MSITREQKSALVKAAIEASEYAYIPYSKYKVGAAILTESGEIFKGCNVENASYPIGVCAERTAVVKAVSEGKKNMIACAVVTRDGGSPCGMCRQTLNEFNPKMHIILAKLDGEIMHEMPLNELLPLGFGPENLL
ncbi:Cytidine deaminase [Giardia duodenalis assemblage B]|uniref:Cytidine deaminase n=3 Tax=Giardia intestinalis TaxID=5741 RepID=A0A132NR99_GIAIN|nr:Cytidine deaminase [Giardia intestinalis ATCC 50581]ESU42006.1 Cytidine deaminase [Giardia intestinalis]KWX12242.1 Cytidine deaminase [Giardia intestinalis assemblage B]